MPIDLIKIITDLGMGGCVIWIVFVTFRQTLPKMMNDFREELREERKVSAQIIAALEQNTRLVLYLIARITGKKFKHDDPVEDLAKPHPNCPEKCPFLSDSEISEVQKA